MTAINTVVQSIETPEGGRCVDIFERPDGTCGFEEYRREPEDRWGWFPVGEFGAAVFETPGAALAAARDAVPWLREVTPAP